MGYRWWKVIYLGRRTFVRQLATPRVERGSDKAERVSG
jgi:hypothetical protein